MDTEPVTLRGGDAPTEAQAVLWGMGCVFEDDGWRLPGSDDDVAARILVEAILKIKSGGREVIRKELKALIHRLR